MLPVLKSDKECKVCGKCYLACTKDAIHFKLGRLNFYPVVNPKLCVECGKCQEACKSNFEGAIAPIDEQQVYIGASKDKEILKVSSSGGIFSEIANFILGRDGVVFGATFDEESYTVKHISINNAKELHKLRKSKYVQSDWVDTVKELKEAIKDEKYILFTGTPCQVSSVKSKFGGYSRIYFVDLFCHGVGNAKVFQDYLKSLKEKVTAIDFRFQTAHVISNYYLNIENPNQVVLREYYDDNLFYKLFVLSASIKKACFSCDYAHKKHDADLTIGDFDNLEYCRNKGIEAMHPSIISINSERGRALFKQIESEIEYRHLYSKEILDKYYRKHEQIKGNWGYNIEIQQKFIEDYVRYGFEQAAINSVYAYEIGLFNEIDQLIRQEKKLYLYGAGVIGKRYIRAIRILRPNWHIEGIIVTSKNRNPDKLEGINVIELKQMCDKESIIIVSVTKKYSDEIIYGLQEQGFMNIFL